VAVGHDLIDLQGAFQLCFRDGTGQRVLGGSLGVGSRCDPSTSWR
jgi:hypothetical protein